MERPSRGRPSRGGIEQLAPILKRWFKKKGLDSLDKYKVFASWDEIIGQEIKQHTNPSRFINHIFEVEVDTPAYLLELLFQKEFLLKQLQQNCEIYVKTIHFVCSGELKLL